MFTKKLISTAFILSAVMTTGCSTLPKKPQAADNNTAQIQIRPIAIGVGNMYMNHINIEPDFFHSSTKSIFKSFLSSYEIQFVDNQINDKESTLSTLPVEISIDDLVKYGFVDHTFEKGKLVAVSRSILHPGTKKSITGIGFFLEGWDGKKWVPVESNRMYEQRAYNIINDIVAATEKEMAQGAAK